MENLKESIINSLIYIGIVFMGGGGGGRKKEKKEYCFDKKFLVFRQKNN